MLKTLNSNFFLLRRHLNVTPKHANDSENAGLVLDMRAFVDIFCRYAENWGK